MKNQSTNVRNVNAIKRSVLAICAFSSLRAGRKLGLTVAVLTAWSLLAWGAAEALITRPGGSHAQVMVVLANVGAYVERTHHAAELWKTGSAPTVVLTNDDVRGSWSQAKQRNLFSYEWATEELERSGVPAEAIEILPGRVNSTFEEALLMRDYVVHHNLNSVLIVTSAYHSRRALSIFRRVFKDTGVDIEINPALPDAQTPHAATWWLSRLGWQTVGPEYPKIAYFWLRQLITGTPQIVNFVPEVEKGVADPEVNGPLIAPAKAFVDEVVLIDARQSTGVSRMPQRDGSPSAVLDFGDGFTANLLGSGHAYRKPGSYTIKLEGRSETGQVVVREERLIIVSDIPTASPVNTQRLNDTGNAITNGANLQRAIDQASRNNSTEQEILLPPSATFAGPIVLSTPNGSRSGNKYITIKSASMSSFPAHGTRVAPADAGLMPTITAPSSSNQTASALWTPNPAPEIPSHNYRLQGIHFRKDVDNRYSQALVSLGDLNVGQNKVSKIPSHFIVDRCYFDGGSRTSTTKDGLRINADYTSVVDSYLASFQIAVGPDATAISIGKGRGPWAVWNSYLEATSENFFIGGGGPAESWSATITNPKLDRCVLSSVLGLEIDMNIALPVESRYGPDQTTVIRSISGNQVTFDPIPRAPDSGGVAEWAVAPSFLEFRRNHLFKPTRWRQGANDYDGSNWQIKNLWETKYLRYAVIDGNVLQNSWVKDQAFSIVLTPRNATGGEHPAVVVREIQFSNNVFRNLANGVSILPSDTQAGYNPTQRSSDITFRNNLFWNVGENWDAGYRQFFAYLEGVSPTDRLSRIHFIHDTFDNGTPKSSQGMITDFGTSGGATQSTWKNNLAAHSGYGFRSAVSNDPIRNISRFLPPGVPSAWDANLIANIGTASYPPRPSGIYPSGPWPTMFVDYSNGNFALAVNSPGKGKALDRTDIGVNMVNLKASTFGTVDGNWNVEPSRKRRTRGAPAGIE